MPQKEHQEFLVQAYQRAATLSTATLHEAAGKIGALPSRMKPLHPSFRLCGWAFPVQSPPADNLWLHRAIYAASPGDVLVVQVESTLEAGYWGEVMTHAAQQKQLGGLVIDGGIRDSQRLLELAFPIFSHGVCIRGTSKNPQGKGSLRTPVLFGDVVVQHGDLVVGDADGVVVLPREMVIAVVEKAQERDATEATILEHISQGATTLDLYHIQ